MDQRLLRTAYKTLENSGYVPCVTTTFNPERMGCYVGAVTNDYALHLRKLICIIVLVCFLSLYVIGAESFLGTLSIFLSG